MSHFDSHRKLGAKIVDMEVIVLFYAVHLLTGEGYLLICVI